MTKVEWNKIRYDDMRKTVWEGKSIRKKYNISHKDETGIFDLWSYVGYLGLFTKLEDAMKAADEHAAKGRKK